MLCCYVNLPVTYDELPYSLHTSNSQPPSDGQDIWPKRVVVLYNEYKNIIKVLFKM